MTDELVCTCPSKTLPMSHYSDCPMVTGIPDGRAAVPHDGGGFMDGGPVRNYEAGEVFLTSPEPPLARVLRARLDDRKVVQVHLLDGSVLVGTVVEVCDDGSTATVDDGSSDLYDFDVSAVCVVQTRRPKA